MDINPLDPAAALAGIEHRAVHQPLDRCVQIGVSADIARILAAQFQAQGHKGARRRAFDGAPPRD